MVLSTSVAMWLFGFEAHHGQKGINVSFFAKYYVKTIPLSYIDKYCCKKKKSLSSRYIDLFVPGFVEKYEGLI